MDLDFLIEVIRKKYKNEMLSTDSEIKLAIEEVMQVIKNYCSIPEVPVALKFTVINMTVDLLEYYFEKTKEDNITNDGDTIEDIDLARVKSISVGDTSISLGEEKIDSETSRTLKSHYLNLDSLTMNYRAQLNQFRRLY